ncbi:MAG: hypothetical protein HC831_30180 [Chloroflexia bacterium]|nr:hypothetical protein [Chloroflexia bacterium]
MASSNSQVQNISRPIIYYNLNDTGKALKCILKTFYKTKPQDYHRTSYLFIYSNEKEVVRDAFFGHFYRDSYNEVQFTLNNNRLKKELRDFIGQKLKITFQDEVFQQTPTVLGYLVVR